MDRDQIEPIFFSAVLAAFGGAVKYVASVIRSKDKISNRRFLLLLAANMFISAFCGIMGLLMLIAAGVTSIAIYGMGAGMFGYMGTQALDIVMLALKKKIDPVSAIIPIPPASDPSVPKD